MSKNRPTTSIETLRFAVLSTAHIDAPMATNLQDERALPTGVEDDPSVPITVLEDEYRLVVLPYGDKPVSEWPRHYQDAAASLYPVLAWAERHECNGVILDRDGDLIEELGWYDW